MSPQDRFSTPFSSLPLADQYEALTDIVNSVKGSIAKEFTGFRPILLWLKDSFGDPLTYGEPLGKMPSAPRFFGCVEEWTYVRQMARVYCSRAGNEETSPTKERHILLCQRPVCWIQADFEYSRRYTMGEWVNMNPIPKDKFKIDFVGCKHMSDAELRNMVMTYPKLAGDLLTSLVNLSKATVAARFSRLQKDILTAHKLEMLLCASGVNVKELPENVME